MKSCKEQKNFKVCLKKCKESNRTFSICLKKSLCTLWGGVVTTHVSIAEKNTLNIFKLTKKFSCMNTATQNQPLQVLEKRDTVVFLGGAAGSMAACFAFF